VAHGAFWVDRRGHAPLPNTLITMQDLHAGLWRPRKEESMVRNTVVCCDPMPDWLTPCCTLRWQDYCIAILQQLEANQQLYGHRSSNAAGEGGIVIKPDHCLVSESC
jgi:hypothetical protein